MEKALTKADRQNTVTVLCNRIMHVMDRNSAQDSWFQGSAARAIHEEQLARVERFNGRAAMLGFVIGVVTEGLTGQGILHQIGLGPLVDGYAACSAQYLPFCF